MSNALVATPISPDSQIERMESGDDDDDDDYPPSYCTTLYTNTTLLLPADNAKQPLSTYRTLFRYRVTLIACRPPDSA